MGLGYARLYVQYPLYLLYKIMRRCTYHTHIKCTYIRILQVSEESTDNSGNSSEVHPSNGKHSLVDITCSVYPPMPNSN